MSKERRRHLRIVVEIDVEVSVQINKKDIGKVVDLSESGLFVETGMHVEMNNFVVIKLSGETIMFGATVRRVTGKGFGAEFGCMTDSHRDAISNFHLKSGKADVASTEPLPTIMLIGDHGAYPSLGSELKAAGYAVLEVRNVDKVFSSLARFDVVGVVSEYVVGGRNTLSTLEAIKGIKKQPQFPVILYSGRYDVPQQMIEELGIPCFFKYNTASNNLVCYITQNRPEALEW